MNNYDDIVRLLWVSDIHYKCYDAATLTYVTDYIGEFVAKVKEIHNEKPIDYVLLSGDIAFDGSDGNYKCFRKEVLDRLVKEVFKGGKLPKLITIPGNHDISWAGSKVLLGKYIDRWGAKNSDRNDFLREAKDEFRALFMNYTKAFTQDIPAAQKTMFDLQHYTEQDTENEYNRTRLFGHVLDKENGLLFILLNSAWFSLGTMFDETLTEVLKEKTLWRDDIAEKIIEYKRKFYEYGGQIIGRQLLSNVDLPGLMHKYSDLTVILCLHHPAHWLEWGEMYSENQETLHLPRMIESADILLTGHEHLPANTPVLPLPHDTLHFMAGKFLADDVGVGRLFFEHNRFSVLDIVRKYVKPSVQETRYEYINRGWASHPLSGKFLLKSPARKFRKPDLESSIVNFKLDDYIRERILYLNAGYPLVLETIPNDVPVLNVVKALKADVNDIHRVFVFTLESPELLFAMFGDQPMELYKLVKFVPDICTFISLDYKFDTVKTDGLLLQEEYEENEEEVKWNRMLKGFNENAERVFDTFRANHFNKLERLYSDGKLLTPSDELHKMLEIRFVNHVVPYWLLERYSKKTTTPEL